jgi:hypothetical protein
LVVIANIPKSKKIAGKYEEVLIGKLTRYFESKGYSIIPHSRLNIAWGPIISDVDILLIKDGLITCVEVKSKKDNINRAPQQVNRIKDFVDYIYIATEKRTPEWALPDVGLILVQQDEIKLIKRPKKLSNKPTFLSVLSLRKKCIAKLLGKDINFKAVDKYDLAQNVYSLRRSKCSRKYLREIVTCGESCSEFCPIDRISEKIN